MRESPIGTLRPLTLGAVMIAVFCTSLGVLWWRGRSAVPVTETPAASAPAEPVPAPPAAPPVVVGLGPPAALPAAVPAPPRKAQPTAEQSADSDPDGPELPVVVGFIRKNDVFRDASTNYISTHRWVNEGIVSNGADGQLTVTIVDTDVPTQQSTETLFDLGKGAQRHFGQRDGLTMASGDLITLKSPHYRPFTQQVP